MYECVRWGERGARLNDIAPGIIVTPLAIDEFNGPRGDFYKNMFAKCPAGRPGTADEMANIAELLMSDAGAFITGSTFLADGGATIGGMALGIPGMLIGGVIGGAAGVVTGFFKGLFNL